MRIQWENVLKLDYIALGGKNNVLTNKKKNYHAFSSDVRFVFKSSLNECIFYVLLKRQI